MSNLSHTPIPAGSCCMIDEEAFYDLLADHLSAITHEFEKDGFLVHSAPGIAFLDNGDDRLIMITDAARQEAFINRLRNEHIEKVIMELGDLSMNRVIEMTADQMKDQEGTTGDLTEIKELLSELLMETKRLNRRGGRNFENLDARWLNVNAAALYCGDYSPDRFRKVAKENEIPRHGPHRNLYDRLELDEWILDPHCFRFNRPGRHIGRRVGAMDKIQHFTLSVVRSATETGTLPVSEKPAVPMPPEPISEELYAVTLAQLRIAVLRSLIETQTGQTSEAA